MFDKNKQILCTGTLFDLLLLAIKPKRSTQRTNDGRTDKISEPAVLQALLEVFNPKITYPGPNTGRKNCTEFKKCEIKESSWIDFTNKNSLKEFNYTFLNNYTIIFSRINKMFEQVMAIKDNNKINLLGRSLLELIHNDETINDDEIFYILKDKVGISKKDITPHLEYEIQPLVLGIFHFTLQRTLEEKAGHPTFLQFYKKDGKRWYFYSNIGQNTFKETKIKVLHEEISSAPIIQNNHQPATVEQKTVKNPLFKKYEKYFKKEVKELSNVKTILYKDSPASFHDLYVMPDISNIPSQDSKEKKIILTGDIVYTKNYLDKFGRFTSIIAPAGYGKSMFMKHLFLNDSYNNIKNEFKTELVPILIKIRSFRNGVASLENMLYKKIKTCISITNEEFLKDLYQGGFLLLFDGLDEITTTEVDTFFIQLEELTIKYPNNYFITSSRPSESMESLSKFKVLNLHSLDWDHSLELITKLPNYSEEVKKEFCYIIEDESCKKYKKIAEIPLLLTLMFKVYLGKKKLPVKTHLFYEKAYEVLYEEHEILKGHEPRPFKTGLRKTNFLILLSEFCYNISKNPTNEISSTEIARALRKTSFSNIDPDDFIEDLKDNLNLLYKENGKYHFIHNSFKECFCAKHLSDMDDSDFIKLIDWFEDFKNVKNPKTYYLGIKGKEIFTFLLQMCNDKTKKLLIYPYLNKQLEGPMQSGFLNYIYNIYEKIEYGYESYITPKMHFAKILLAAGNMNTYIDFYNLDLPETNEYINNGYYMVPQYDIEGEWHGYERWDDLDLERYLKNHPDETDESLEIKKGVYNVYDYVIPIIKLKEINEESLKIIALLESEKSPLYKQYKRVYYYKEK